MRQNNNLVDFALDSEWYWSAIASVLFYLVMVIYIPSHEFHNPHLKNLGVAFSEPGKILSTAFALVAVIKFLFKQFKSKR